MDLTVELDTLLWISVVAVVAVLVQMVTLRAVVVRRARTPTLLLPRYFLLLNLYDQMPYVPGVVGVEDHGGAWNTSKWKQFCEKFVKILEHLKNVVPQSTLVSESEEDNSTLKNDAVWIRLVTGLADVTDNELVPLIREYPGLAQLLVEYLPKTANQTWDDFLKAKYDAVDTDCWDYLHSEVGANAVAFRVELLSSLLRLAGELTELEKAYPDEARGDEQSEELGYAIVRIFYATDRQVTNDGEFIGVVSKRAIRGGSSSNGSEALAAGALHFGVIEVGVPATHTAGQMEKPSNGEDADPVSHVLILSVDTKLRDNSDKFVKMVNQDLDCLKDGSDKEVLVFIHGYNVTHKEAVKRAAQLKYDLKFDGVVVAYSWSSQGTLVGYLHDEESAEQTGPCLEKFLWLITKELKSAERIHILAHSMGNRPAIRALTAFYHEDKRRFRLSCMRTPFSQIIFAAADEDRRKAEGLFDLLKTAFGEPVVDSGKELTVVGNPGLTPHFTVYCATDDVALHASRTVHFKVRLGDTRSYIHTGKSSHRVEHERISDVVDASGLDERLWQLGHSYYGSNQKVIKDIRSLLMEKKRADARLGELLCKCTVKGKQFYTFSEYHWKTKRGCI